MRVITNSLGSGDWIVVTGKAGEILFEGHRISAFDLTEILSLAVEANIELIELTDEQLEEGTY